jgi:hypothetical protein
MADNHSNGGKFPEPNDTDAETQLRTFVRTKSEIISGVLIFVTCFLIFWCSPVHQVTDSSYSMLLSESLLHHRSFELDHYAIPHGEPKWIPIYFRNGEIYQLELVNGSLYYYLPPGTSILSVPFVAVMNMFGVSAANADGTYNPAGEERIQISLAAILMAALACVFFCTARLVLAVRWSAIIALGGTLGTQIWSTTSRGMWSETWGTLLLAIVLLMLLKQDLRKGTISPVILGTLVSWLYFVRPTYSFHIFAITLYLVLFHREHLVRYLITGAAWLAGFMIYSWHIYHQLVPSYYRVSRLHFAVVWAGLAGNLLSPSRGVLIYVPLILFVGYLLVIYRREIKFPKLVLLTLLVIACHLFVTSATQQWWGGHAFGARFTTGLVPWFVLLAIIGVQAMLVRRNSGSSSNVKHRIELAAGAAFLLVSITINGLGATDRATWTWNMRPSNIDQHPERLWDWRQPQFLAGFVHPPLPDAMPPLQSGPIDFSKPESDIYLWYGWSAAESEYRWTDSKEAALVFALAPVNDLKLEMKLRPFLLKGKLEEQRVYLNLNGQRIETLVLKEDKTEEYKLLLPKGLLRERNVLVFELPDASSPLNLGVNQDSRRLGIAMSRMQLQIATTGQKNLGP